MKMGKDILDDLKRNPYSVPDGYFDRLKGRLNEIAVSSVDTVPRSLWQRIRPYAALAACFAASFLIGNAILRKTAPGASSSDQFYKELMYSDLIPVTQPYAIFEMEDEEEMETSDEDIINFLIETGVSVELIAYVELLED
jgi:hypothetical protein